MSSRAGTTKDREPAVETKDGGDEAFLRRWSRRKHEARAKEVKPVPVKQPADPPPQNILTDADMPPVESLNADSDFSVFMSSGVSEELRRQALRKLFALPEFGERCPLDSEWYDCRNLEPLGNVVTHEMREQLEREAQKLKKRAIAALREKPKAPVETAVAEPNVIPSADSAPAQETLPPQSEGNTNNENVA